MLPVRPQPEQRALLPRVCGWVALTGAARRILFIPLLCAAASAQHPATCRIDAPEGNGVVGHGSGVLYQHLDNGTCLVITAAHVVRGCRMPYIVFPGKPKRPARILGSDSDADVAVLHAYNKGWEKIIPPELTEDTSGKLIQEGYPHTRYQQKISRDTGGRWSMKRGLPAIETNQPSAQGFSGGPIYCVGSDGQWRLAGIISGSDRTTTLGPRIVSMKRLFTRVGCWRRIQPAAP